MEHVNWLFGKDGALFKASATGKLELTMDLVAEGANINASSSNGFTPLHRAAQNGHKDVVIFLLERGADSGIESIDHQTPLSLATQNGHEEVITVLNKYRKQK